MTPGIRIDSREELLSQFDRDGYAVVRGVLDVENDLQPVIQEYGRLADRLACDYLNKRASSGHDFGGPTEDRLLYLMRLTDGACFQAMDITLPVEDRIRADTPIHLGREVFQLLRNSRLLDAVEAFIGPEIYSVPVQHMRIKSPEAQISKKTAAHTKTLTGKTYWHQDLAVITEDADETNMLGVWLPLNKATEENGCLVVVPGSHKSGLVEHYDTADCQGIPDELIPPTQRALPTNPGDLVFLHPLIMHSSLPNYSDGGRWSFDLRYCTTGQPNGRQWFPGFVARSRVNPGSEMTSARDWTGAWHGARARLAGQPRPNFHRPSVSDHRFARDGAR
jgi:phytanoyl-CoA hydroxylase